MHSKVCKHPSIKYVTSTHTHHTSFVHFVLSLCMYCYYLCTWALLKRVASEALGNRGKVQCAHCSYMAGVAEICPRFEQCKSTAQGLWQTQRTGLYPVIQVNLLSKWDTESTTHQQLNRGRCWNTASTDPSHTKQNSVPKRMNSDK